MTRALVITNPAAARTDPIAVEVVMATLRSAGWDAEVLATGGPGDAGRLAAYAVQEKMDVCAVFGGDGTTMQAAAALVGSDVTLGLIPGGTGNLLAGNLRIPANPARAAKVLVSGVPRRIDLGRLDRASGSDYFAVACGAGYDAVIMGRTASEQKRRWGMLAYVATTIAEYFRDQGLSVLLLVDSLTRFARAQREIGLASGEPPTRRSYPPSIFSMLPQLLERAGQGRTGAITAVYSVLTEGDEENDPIAEEVRSILDGHIVLSRKLAAANHYPAIDVLASVSRVMPMVTSTEHRHAAGRARALLAKYQEIELLVQIGEYEAGNDAQADAAVNARDSLAGFLKQPADGLQPLAQTIAALTSLVDAAEAGSEEEGA